MHNPEYRDLKLLKIWPTPCFRLLFPMRQLHNTEYGAGGRLCNT